eukprot:8728936-Lingulodinium_polyedra.AAC.1
MAGVGRDAVGASAQSSRRRSAGARRVQGVRVEAQRALCMLSAQAVLGVFCAPGVLEPCRALCSMRAACVFAPGGTPAT